MYIATSYIGRDYTPGEIIRENLPKETIERLLKAGAIRKAAPAQAAEEVPQEPPETELPPEDEREDAETEEAPEEAGEPETAEEPEDEIDEEAEAPEIDVMDGLVTAPAEEEKPARTAARKSAGKAAKGGKTK